MIYSGLLWRHHDRDRERAAGSNAAQSILSTFDPVEDATLVAGSAHSFCSPHVTTDKMSKLYSPYHLKAKNNFGHINFEALTVV